MPSSDKPTKADFKNFWSVFEAQQERKKRQRTIPPENFTTTDQEQK